MYIHEIHIKNFRHLENLHLGPFFQPPELSDLIVLAGPNGSGKSSVLELLGYALSQAWSLGWGLRRTLQDFSFEVAIALTEEERQTVRQFIQESGGGADDVIQYLQQSGVYFRAYNYEEGKYQQSPGLYNSIHNFVLNALRNKYNRSPGFFIKSDRDYPPQGFIRERLFDYAQLTQQNYIWSMAFNTSDVQYRDIFDYLVQQRYHYFRKLGAHRHQTRLAATGEPEPTDPLAPYDELLQRLFPGYKFADKDEDVPTNLYIQIPSGKIIPFSDLSSGEKEVFFISAFFLRHDVTSAVIVIDEPELHLHPELARRLIRTMQSIKPNNQLWLATHNAEIIDEAGRDRVIYFERDLDTWKSIVTLGTDEAEAVRKLKDLFGYSGYIGIAKSMVFLEGADSSSDRKMFSNLFPSYGNSLKFIPSNSSEHLVRLNAAILSILESNLGWMQFYLIRDRDYLTQETIEKYLTHLSGRIYVLNRHEIENYLLDEDLIAKVQSDIFNKPTDAATVNQRLRAAAKSISGEVLRDMVSFRLNMIYRPEDFSLGKFMNGEKFMDNDGNWIEEKVDSLRHQIHTKSQAINENLSSITESTSIDGLVEECQRELQQAISEGSNEWKNIYPGKCLFEEYVKNEGLGKAIVLQNSLIKEMSITAGRTPDELNQIIQIIVEGRNFN